MITAPSGKATSAYPAIAFLMKSGIVSYDQSLATLLKDIAWKDLNQKFKNNFEKTLEYVLSSKSKEDRASLEAYVQKVQAELAALDLSLLGKKMKPPDGY